MNTVHDKPLKNKLAERISRVQEQIAAACERVGRDPGQVTLIAVSKTFPWTAIQPAYDAGLRDFGENYMQDAISKVDETAGYGDIRWHFIGHLQRNKVRYWNRGFYLFHCLDSLTLAGEFEKRAAREDKVVSALVQIKLGDEVSKSGIEPALLFNFLEDLDRFPHLSIKGLMTIPPYQADPEGGRRYFRELRGLRDECLVRNLGDPQVFKHLSMGMSHDYPVAVEEGATYVRVGTAIFGPR